MVRYLFCFLFLSGFAANAQQKDSSTIYYDKDWRILVDNGEDVFYIRKAIKANDIWFVNDYYKSNGALQMSGGYKYALDSVKVGDFKYYFASGKLSEEGKYVDGKREGIWKEWHENGNVSSVANYSQGYIIGKYESWWDNGNKYCEVQYLDDIDKIRSYEKKDSTGKSITRLGVFTGICKYHFKNGVMSSKEEWRNDSLVNMEVWNENGVSETPTRNKDGLLTCEVMAEFDGGIIGLQKFLVKNIRYPNKSRKRKEEGKTVLRFTVGEKGEVENIVVEKTSGYPFLDEETVRVAKLMAGKWTPGKQHNQPVRVYYTLPVTYKLDK